jgi:hypothetical protein
VTSPSTAYRTERSAFFVLFAPLCLFALWTGLHQFATFASISWTTTTLLAAWLLVPAVALAGWQAHHVARLYVEQLPQFLAPSATPAARYVWFGCLGVLACSLLLGAFNSRYLLFVMCLLVVALLARREKSPAPELAVAGSDGISPRSASLCLFGLTALVVLVVLCANRSDFDDAEYIQLALQTLGHPDKAVFGFDASLGEVLEKFRFAPYRVTSYETLVALATQWTGLDILDSYYLLVPAVAAAISVLTAFAFLRWFLPLRWSLLALVVFALIALAWGETHVAYGNRMYVRLFQGKGWLVTVTTPLTTIIALLWMRRPDWRAWIGLMIMQVVAVGVSSSGIVITLFATATGLLAGLLTRPGWKGLAMASMGATTLIYPLGLGLWIKYMSSATGKVEEIGTYLPVEASLGGDWRLSLGLAVMVMAIFVNSKRLVGPLATDAGTSGVLAARSFFWLLTCGLLLVFNPFLIEHLSAIMSKNMNWRLAWAVPMPLLLATGFGYLLYWAHERQRRDLRIVNVLAVCGLAMAFLAGGPWALASTNNVSWGFFERKLPPEYYLAQQLSKQIREEMRGQSEICVLVEPRVGTWLTVVAPDFKLVMPGHGYPVTLATIMEERDFQQRSDLVANIGAIAQGDASRDHLLDVYRVNVIAIQETSKAGAISYGIRTRPVQAKGQ